MSEYEFNDSGFNVAVENEKLKVIKWHKDKLDNLTRNTANLEEEKECLETVIAEKKDEAAMIKATIGYLERW